MPDTSMDTRRSARARLGVHCSAGTTGAATNSLTARKAALRATGARLAVRHTRPPLFWLFTADQLTGTAKPAPCISTTQTLKLQERWWGHPTTQNG